MEIRSSPQQQKTKQLSSTRKRWHATGKGTEYEDPGQLTDGGPGAYNRTYYVMVTMRNGFVAKVKEEKTMNLYFPDAWMEQAQRVFERAFMYQHPGAGEPLTPGWCSYFCGLTGDLAGGYHYIVGRSLVNAGFRQNVPAWVYTHTYNPYMERGGK